MTSACIATLSNCCILSVLAVACCSRCSTYHEKSLHYAVWQKTELQESRVHPITFLAAVMGYGGSQVMGVCNTSRQPCLADGFPEVTSPQHASTEYSILSKHMLPMNTLNNLTHLSLYSRSGWPLLGHCLPSVLLHECMCSKHADGVQVVLG